MNTPGLRFDGLVERPAEFTCEDLAQFPVGDQVPDVSRLDPKRPGEAVTLAGLLRRVGAKDSATHLGLHSSKDNFHASIPLEPVRDRGILIYRLRSQPLDEKSGGPFRFFIPDFAACHTHDIDECANVKFVDHMELTNAPGFDNRPHDAQQHAALHAAEEQRVPYY